MKTKQVTPVGILYVGDREYYLLHPTPLQGDSFPQGGWVRFLVVPDEGYYERHLIVHGDWLIEYMQFEPMTIEVLEDEPAEMEDYNVGE